MEYTLEQIEHACLTTVERFQGYYLDWLNNFISVQGYADHYRLPLATAEKRVSIGRRLHRMATETRCQFCNDASELRAGLCGICFEDQYS